MSPDDTQGNPPMKSIRVSIVGAMALVVVFGWGLTALVSPSPPLASATFTVALSALLIAALGASLRGRHRTFWLGFAVFGWGYALFSFAPGAETQIRPYLLTTLMLDAAFPFLGLAPDTTNFTAPFPGGGWGSGRQYYWQGSPEYGIYQRVGHSLAILLHGLAGGALAFLWDAHEGADGRKPG